MVVGKVVGSLVGIEVGVIVRSVVFENAVVVWCVRSVVGEDDDKVEMVERSVVEKGVVEIIEIGIKSLP